MRAVLFATALVAAQAAFLLPGTARNYVDGELVPMDVNVLQSINTHLPYEYYSMRFCRPSYQVHKDESENIGFILLGDRIRKSPYDKLAFGENIECIAACDPIKMNSTEKALFDTRIKEEYMVNLILDGLPVAVQNPDTDAFTVGFPIGAKEKDRYVLYNHLEFTVKWHPDLVKDKKTGDDKEVKRIVAFNVRPHSFKHPVENGKVAGCGAGFNPQRGQLLFTDDEFTSWSYSVRWEESSDLWATRWDAYLKGSDSEIHWFSIVNSLMIVMFLTGMVAVIMLRTLRRDITKYNQVLDEDEMAEETGWKQVHTDVFRPPPQPHWLACYNGTGVQFIGMSLTILVFACLGFLSPANRGGLFTAMLLCFCFLGVYAGYTTARLMKMWDRDDKSWTAPFLTATILPGEMFCLFFVINWFVWKQGSSAAVPFRTMVMVLLLWFVVLIPLTMLGAALGYRRPAIEPPVRTMRLERHIPEQPWYMRPVFTILMGGILPFGAVFIELFFILTSIWLNRYYYVFGFLFLVFIILVVTCAEITIVMIYFQLCSEDYNWWWRAFYTSGSSGLYLFAYSGFYFFTSTLRMKKGTSILIFFGYMGAISYTFFIMTGTIGFLACLFFVRKIYGSLKID